MISDITPASATGPVEKAGLCRFCHAFCPMQVTLEDGRVTQLIGDKDNPVYHGYSCIKGRNYHHFHSDPQRVLQPLARSANGALEPVSSTAAIDAIGGKLRRIIDQYGPRAVAMYTGTFSHFCVAGVMTRQAFMGSIGSPMLFTNATIDQPGKPIAMALHGRWGGGPQAFADADVCMLVGSNTLVSMWGGIPAFNPAKRLHDAKARGLRLIVIDPRRTETARHADIHLQCLPGHDAEILAAMLHVILRENLHDPAFIASETEGYEALCASVAAFTPEAVASGAGLQAPDIIAAARLFASGRSGNATGGTGSNMSPHGTLMEYLLLALNTVCGRWVKAGEQVPNLGVLFRMYSGVARAEKPRPATGFGEQLRVRGFTDTAAGLPTPALADEILTPGEGQVRALFVVGGNPLAAFPNRDKTRRALESLDLLVVIDPQLSATAEFADYVIGPRFGFELPAVSFANEGMVTYGLSIGYQEPWAMYQPALVEPPAGADVMEDWRFFYELARRLDVPLGMRGYPWDMQTPPTTDDLIEAFLARSPVPLAEIKQHPQGQLFPARSAPAEVRAADWPYRLNIGHPDMLAELDGIGAGLAAAAPAVPAGTTTEELQLLLVSRREHAVYNSVGHHLPALAAKRPYNPVYLNPEDAAQLGVDAGARVEISNTIGCETGMVAIDATLRPGVVSVAHGFPGAAQGESLTFRGTSTAALIDDTQGYDAHSGLPRMSAVPVTVRRL